MNEARDMNAPNLKFKAQMRSRKFCNYISTVGLLMRAWEEIARKLLDLIRSLLKPLTNRMSTLVLVYLTLLIRSSR